MGIICDFSAQDTIPAAAKRKKHITGIRCIKLRRTLLLFQTTGLYRFKKQTEKKDMVPLSVTLKIRQ